MLLQNFSVIDNLCLPLFIKNIEITQDGTEISKVVDANDVD